MASENMKIGALSLRSSVAFSAFKCRLLPIYTVHFLDHSLFGLLSIPFPFPTADPMIITNASKWRIINLACAVDFQVRYLTTYEIIGFN